MNNQYFIRMADLLIKVTSEYSIDFDERSGIFIGEPIDSPDICYYIEDKNYDISSARFVYKAVKYHIYERDGEYIWQFRDMNEQFIMRCENEQRTKYHIYIKKETFDRVNSIMLVNFFALEGAMLHYHAFWLHSSFVRWKGKGIVFTAPSGTGKSTQAELWKKYKGADTLNGDRTLIRCVDGIYKGYGSVYAGSSDIYRNESAPIEAVVILKQGKENCLERIPQKEAFRCVYRETLLNPWDASYVSSMMQQVVEMITSVSVYRLTCRPDKSAVELLCDKLEQQKKQKSGSQQG